MTYSVTGKQQHWKIVTLQICKQKKMELLKGVTAVRVCPPVLDQYYFLTLIHPRSFLTQNHSQSAAPHL